MCINKPAILECHVILNTAIGSDLSVLNISWYHNGTYLSTNNVTRDDDQYLYISTLYLISVSDTNSGEYICEANIVEDKKLVMNSTNVNVQGQYYNCQLQQLYFLLAIPRAMISVIPEYFLYPGVDVLLKCESFNNSYNISGPAGFNINQPIMINSLNFFVKGDYNCTSSNECGEDFDTLTLEMMGKLCLMQLNDNVHFPSVPNITVTGHYSNLTVGSSVSISCTTVPPIPNSEIKWQSSSFNSDSNELIINPVMLSHNNETFTCVVSSDLLDKNLTKDITITVLG